MSAIELSFSIAIGLTVSSESQGLFFLRLQLMRKLASRHSQLLLRETIALESCRNDCVELFDQFCNVSHDGIGDNVLERSNKSLFETIEIL